jgi:hypothetical protein
MEEFHTLVLTGDQVNVVYQGLAAVIDLLEGSRDEQECQDVVLARQVQLALDGLR